jgi:hypothetical protein
MVRMSCFLLAGAAILAATQTVEVRAQTRQPTPTILQRPAEGFNVPIPAGWIEKADPESGTMIVQRDQPNVLAMVFVQKEAAPATVTDVLANSLAKLKADKTRTLITSRIGAVADRPALIAILEDKTARYKLTLVPRDKEDKSQTYYGVMQAAPAALFTQSEPVFDRIVAGFQILQTPGSGSSASATPAVRTPPAASTPAAKAPPAASAPAAKAPAAASAQAPSSGDFDRAKAIERILGPQP